MADLLLGPLLRHVGAEHATVWVETDSPCDVEVLGWSAPTFQVEKHHYAIVAVEGLERGKTYEYGVKLDGERVWPPAGSAFPPSAIRTVDPEATLKLLFGSCRVSLPHEPPYTLPRDVDGRGRGHDALRTYAVRMRDEPPAAWPDGLLLIGDQVYADEVSPRTLEFIRSRRDTSRPPGEEVADFEEYTRLYRESWQEPTVRWLLSTVPTAMLFDDHDVHDDWNVSHSWVERMRQEAWWEERIVGAFMSYWVYQQLGNLAPRELEEDELLTRLRASADGGALLREFAHRADREPEEHRWSFSRDFGRVRLVGIDCRAGRVVTTEERSMLDRREWEWLEEQVSGDFDHLLLALPDPFLLGPGAHYFQAWNEAVCGGAFGHRLARVGVRLREGADLDHWASFQRCFARLAELLGTVGRGERGAAPAAIVALSGDVHHAYLAEAAFRRGAGVTSRVYQAVCSPLRNPLEPKQRVVLRFTNSRAGELVGRALASIAGARSPDIEWRLSTDPSFENQIGTIEATGRHALVRVEKAVPSAAGARLETVFERQLV